MTTGMSEEEIYRKARERVEEKKGFYIHFIVYILVNIMLIIIWAATGAGFPWFIFPLGGWGIGILFHFLGIFVFSRQTGWERRQVEKEVERLKRGE
ncbi:hypothetical protein ES703_100440 [subsurface metagenome]